MTFSAEDQSKIEAVLDPFVNDPDTSTGPEHPWVQSNIIRKIAWLDAYLDGKNQPLRRGPSSMSELAKRHARACLVEMLTEDNRRLLDLGCDGVRKEATERGGSAAMNSFLTAYGRGHGDQ